ncbi:hypothetical protein JOM56_006881 [Amanita muscaria]
MHKTRCPLSRCNTRSKRSMNIFEVVGAAAVVLTVTYVCISVLCFDVDFVVLLITVIDMNWAVIVNGIYIAHPVVHPDVGESRVSTYAKVMCSLKLSGEGTDRWLGNCHRVWRLGTTRTRYIANVRLMSWMRSMGIWSSLLSSRHPRVVWCQNVGGCDFVTFLLKKTNNPLLPPLVKFLRVGGLRIDPSLVHF